MTQVTRTMPDVLQQKESAMPPTLKYSHGTSITQSIFSAKTLAHWTLPMEKHIM